MRAVIVEQPGGTEALKVRDLASPDPGAGEIRVKVSAAGVNFIDIYERTGAYPLVTPFIVGSEGAGRVSAVGHGVTGIAVNDRVAWAHVKGAGYAEQVILPAERAVPIPDGVQDDEAAAVLLQGITAHYLSTSTFPVGADHTILVHAAAGGVGLLLTQMAAAKGARVIGLVSTHDKGQLSKAAGATHVIRTDDDWAAEVRALTDGCGVDAVFDGVGRATFDASISCLRRRGTMILFGAASGPVPAFDPQTLSRNGSLYLTRPALGDYIADRDELIERAGSVLAALAAGRLRVRVGGRYSLEEAAFAHDDLHARRTTGKLLIVP
ncbi:quinone oxidoreductase [Nocardioides sp. AN3]